MNQAPQQTYGTPSTTSSILLEVERVAEMRAMLHELANVFTGILITGGVLAQRLEGTKQAESAGSVCHLGERGSDLVRRMRAVLLGAPMSTLKASGESEV